METRLFEDDYIAGNPSLAGTGSLVVVSGCSGSGKSSLLTEMARRDYPVQPEAGRQIVKEQLLIGGDALPWANAAWFAELAASRAACQFNIARPGPRPTLFDRSVVDLVAWFGRSGLPTPAHLKAMLDVYRFANTVFMSPPWRELFRTDTERRHGFAEAVTEYDGLVTAYQDLGYRIVEIPRAPLTARADFLESDLNCAQPEDENR